MDSAVELIKANSHLLVLFLHFLDILFIGFVIVNNVDDNHSLLGVYFIYKDMERTDIYFVEDDGRIYNAKGAYVDFLWNKFRVTADGGLRREYRYIDDLFIDALVKAHADVASDSQRVISIMIDTETELHKKNKDSKAS